MRLFRETGGDKGLPKVVLGIFDEDFVLKGKESGDGDCGEDDDYDERSHDRPVT